MITDVDRWRAIREANTVPGSSAPDVWTAAYRAAVVASVAARVGVPFTEWQRAYLFRAELSRLRGVGTVTATITIDTSKWDAALRRVSRVIERAVPGV